jgi:hypothetical protein
LRPKPKDDGGDDGCTSDPELLLECWDRTEALHQKCRTIAQRIHLNQVNRCQEVYPPELGFPVDEAYDRCVREAADQ